MTSGVTCHDLMNRGFSLSALTDLLGLHIGGRGGLSRLLGGGLLLAAIAIGVPLVLQSLLGTRDGGLRVVIFAAALMPAVWLAHRESSYLIDYFMVVVVVNRFWRRVIDWMEGQFDPTPLSSILPEAIGCLVALAVVRRWPSLPGYVRKAALFLFFGLAYGLAMGYRNGFGAVYAMAGYVMPFAILLYPIAIRADLKTLDRWIRVMVGLAVVVAVYGWVQWTILPPWDAQWLRWAGISSMGAPEPFRIGICSTLESRGPFAWFMGTAAIPMLAAALWRRPWGWLGPLIVVSAAVLSMARTSWGFIALGLIFFVALREGRGLLRVGVLAAVVMAGLVIVMPMLPEGDRFASRAESLTAISEDGSFQTRVGIAQHGLQGFLNRPQGYGLGSTGLAGKLTGQGAVIGDNGYFALLADFGLPGFIAIAVGLGMIVRKCFEARRLHPDHAALGLAMFGSGIVFLIIGNWIDGPYAAMLMMIVGCVAGRAISVTGARTRRASSWPWLDRLGPPTGPVETKLRRAGSE